MCDLERSVAEVMFFSSRASPAWCVTRDCSLWSWFVARRKRSSTKTGSQRCRHQVSWSAGLSLASPLPALRQARPRGASLHSASAFLFLSKQVFTVLPRNLSVVLFSTLSSSGSAFNAPQVLWSNRAVEFGSVISGSQ